MRTSTLEARVSQLEEQLRRTHRLLAIGAAVSIFAIAVACKSPPQSLQIGHVRVDESGVRIDGESGDVLLGRDGLTIAHREKGAIVRTTAVRDDEIELKTVGAGSVSLWSSGPARNVSGSLGGPTFTMENDAARVILAAHPGDAALNFYAGKALASLDVTDRADEPTCQPGALCKGSSVLYLDDGRGRREKLSTYERKDK